MADIEAKHKKLYPVKVIAEITYLNRNQIYYWSKKLGAILPAQEVPGRQLFDLRAVLSFRLSAELLRFGLSPERTAEIIDYIGRKEIEADGQLLDIREEPWDVFLRDRWKYEKNGFFLISKEENCPGGSFLEFFLADEKGAESVVSRATAADPLKMRSTLLVNLLNIIHEVEEKTGEELV